MNVAKSSTVSAIERSKTVFNDFLSVPKIIGTGPIITAPPPFVLAFPADLIDNKRIARVKMPMPTRKLGQSLLSIEFQVLSLTDSPKATN